MVSTTTFSGVASQLVGRAHLDAALVREGDGALGLEEGVLGERRLEGARHLVRGAGERGGSVAADHVALLADVVLGRDPVAKGEVGLVEHGRALGAGLLDGADGLEDLVLHLDGLLGLLQRGRVLGYHQGNRVAHAVGDVALGRHDVPVVEQVADRVHGHVGGSEHGKDARHGAGLLGVDLDHAGARVLGAHGAGVGEVGEVALVDIVGVLAKAQDLAAHVHAEGALAHAVVVAALELGVDALLAPQDGGGEQDALDALYYSRLKAVRQGVDSYWLAEPLRTVFNHSHNLYIDGGDQNMQYGIGVNYGNEKGVMKGSDRDIVALVESNEKERIDAAFDFKANHRMCPLRPQAR